MTDETQKSITDWGRETFGEGTVLATLHRCLIEGMELAAAVEHGVPMDVIEDEVADVDIVFDQVCEQLGITAERRQVLKNKKMAINRARRWGRTATGRAQHVEE